MKSSVPLVSLVMPTFNQAEYVGRAIDSVLAQDYPNIEFIVLDDGSTDDTRTVLSRYADRLRWERHDNIGQAATLNRGWRMSHGEILGYLSSDDLLRPAAVAESVQALLAAPEAVVSYCDFDLIDANDKIVRPVQTKPFSRTLLVEDLVCLPGPGAFFRRNVFDHCGGWDERLRQVPDFDFWLRAQRLGDFIRVPRGLSAYRIHEESASYRPVAESRSDEIVDVVARYWDRMPEPERRPRAMRRSLSMSCLLAARSHFSAGRIGRALTRIGTAYRRDPARLLDPLALRILAGGIVRRPYYHLRRALTTSRAG